MAALPFLVILGLCVGTAEQAVFTMAYNCDHAKVTPTSEFDQCFQGMQCPVFPYRRAMRELRENGFVFTHGFFPTPSPNMSFVLINNNVFKVECPQEEVLLVPSNSCFSQDVHPVKLSSGRNAYINVMNYIVDHADQVPCNGATVQQLAIQKIKDAQIQNIGKEIIAFALLKQNPFFNVMDLFNSDSIHNLTKTEECYLNGDPTCNSLFSMVLFEWRTHGSKIQISFLVFQILYSLFLFLVGCAYRLKFMKSLSLGIPLIKSTS